MAWIKPRWQTPRQQEVALLGRSGSTLVGPESLPGEAGVLTPSWRPRLQWRVWGRGVAGRKQSFWKAWGGSL